MMSYINETDFVIENKQLVYPEIVTDGLQLYYDAKGKRDTDYHRDTMLDMSGNKNHGKLHNFAYEKHSGYKDGLVFDYIDDKLVRPALNLQPNDFTFMLNGNVISFSPDGTVKRVQDGEVIETKGFNLVRNGDFVDGHNKWRSSALADMKATKGLVTIRAIEQYGYIAQNLHSSNNMPSAGEKYYFCANVERDSSSVNLYLNDGRSQTEALGPNTGFISNIRTLLDDPIILLIRLQDDRSANWTDSKISNVMVINLTETFGAGNEPTKEEMDEIINRFGFIPNAQDLIDRIEYKGNDLGDMENIIDGLYKTDVLSGEEVYTDKADDSVVHVEVDGKSVGGGSGKNLLTNDPNCWEIGSVHESADKGTDYSDDSTLRSPYIKLNKGVYSLSIEGNREYKNATNWYHIYNENKDGLVASGWDSGNRSFTIDEDGYFVRILVRSNPRVAVNLGDVGNKVFIQIEEGSTATAYEPPAPTPNYPIEIHSLNDFDVVSSVGGRNYLSDSYNFTTTGSDAKGLVRSITEEGFLKIVASPGNGNYSFDWGMGKSRGLIVDNIEVGEIVTFSMEVRSEDSTQNPTFYFGGGMGYYPMEGSVGSEWSRIYVSRPWSTTYWAPHVGFSNVSGTFEFRKGKLEKGTTPTPWTPAPEEIVENTNHPLIDKINLLLDEPLRSVGDIKDRLFRDSDGLWKIERNVGEYKFTGSESGSASGLNISLDVPNKLPSKADKVTNEAIVTHFAPEHHMIYNNPDKTGWHTRGRDESLVFFNYAGKTAEELKQWFKDKYNSGDPVTIQYLLDEVGVETLGQELQDKLNNLRSFQDSNYVYTVINDKTDILSDYVVESLKPTLRAKFLYNNWYKEDRVINNLMIYNRALSNEEMLQNYKTIKRRWGM